MTILLASAVCLALLGPLPAGLLALSLLLARHPKKRPTEPSIRPALLIVLVELRAGASPLSALQRASATLPGYSGLTRAVRVATVKGLSGALESTSGTVGRLVAQLARCQRSGAPAVEVVRSLLESEIESGRARRIERARRLPIRLMIPVALLVLPGVVLLLYAPALIRLWQDMTLPFT